MEVQTYGCSNEACPADSFSYLTPQVSTAVGEVFQWETTGARIAHWDLIGYCGIESQCKCPHRVVDEWRLRYKGDSTCFLSCSILRVELRPCLGRDREKAI